MLKPDTIMVRKIWLFIIVTFLVSTAVSSKQALETDGSQATQVEPVPTSDRSDETGNWRNPLDVSKRSLIMKSFSKDLFNELLSAKIIDAATKTKFMQGMVLGTLNPKEYGGYMVQDTAYLGHAVKALQLAAKQMELQNPIFAHFYMLQAEKYNSYYVAMLKTWRLADVGSVVMGPAAKTYMMYQSVLSQDDPRYLSIAMLPCTMLWPQLARELDKSVKETSPYRHWFEENIRPPTYQGSLEKFVDTHFLPDEAKKASRIFCEGMLNELNFFREACGEELYSLDEVCQM